ncbi:MAG: HAD family hydrolase [Oscillospiraceae bacterium]|jgi:Cof subfamily protein (haloacid dehalogenase superfamily)|nr:HAD family hydrolase [Oscillospiraceae bacterium]
METTLYVSDLDGTLLNPDAELSGYTKDTLNSLIAGGLRFTAATARTPGTAVAILEGLNLDMPVIMMNGVLIYDVARHEKVRMHAIPPEAVKEIIGVLRSCGVTGLMYRFVGDDQSTYYEANGITPKSTAVSNAPMRAFIDERVARYGKAFTSVDSLGDVPAEDTVYFTLIDVPERLRPARDALSRLPGLNVMMYKDTYSRDLWFLEMFSADASKKNAVAYLRQQYGFDRIVGFGDNLNDLPMFEACDVCVAVENAMQEVRGAADHICGANTDDGVVKWIRNTRGRFSCVVE